LESDDAEPVYGPMALTPVYVSSAGSHKATLEIEAPTSLITGSIPSMPIKISSPFAPNSNLIIEIAVENYEGSGVQLSQTQVELLPWVNEGEF